MCQAEGRKGEAQIDPRVGHPARDDEAAPSGPTARPPGWSSA